MSLGPGWITDSELEFHQKYMTSTTGKILEGGAFGGRLFTHLYPLFPDWKYVAVNAWSDEHTYIPNDNTLSYWKDLNVIEAKKDNLMTKKKFARICPWAIAIDGYFEDYNFKEKFNIISIGQISDKIDWNLQYHHAMKLLTEDGVVIARHLNHEHHKNNILQTISNFEILEYSPCGRNAAIKPRR